MVRSLRSRPVERPLRRAVPLRRAPTNVTTNGLGWRLVRSVAALLEEIELFVFPDPVGTKRDVRNGTDGLRLVFRGGDSDDVEAARRQAKPR